MLPLGATVGPAGLAVMPYTLTFKGRLLQDRRLHQGPGLAGQDENEKVAVNGRLITVDGFCLEEAEAGFPGLEATFSSPPT